MFENLFIFWGKRGRKKQNGSYGKNIVVFKWNFLLFYFVCLVKISTNAKGKNTIFYVPFPAFGWHL